MMNDYPWDHLVIDDFLPDDEYQKMVGDITTRKDYFRRQPKERVSEQGHSAQSDWINIAKRNNYIDQSFLEKHFGVTRPYGRLETTYNINYNKANFHEKIHIESEKKILIAVCYLHPEESSGTILHYPDKSVACEVEWKPNRCLIFAHQTDVTWHSYIVPDEDRMTFNTHLVLKR